MIQGEPPLIELLAEPIKSGCWRGVYGVSLEEVTSLGEAVRVKLAASSNPVSGRVDPLGVSYGFIACGT